MKLPAKIADWPAIWRELYEERAGIIENDARMPRASAEFWAEKDIRRQAERDT